VFNFFLLLHPSSSLRHQNLDTTGTPQTNFFNLKAYGAVHKLLAAGIPISWVIRAGKAVNELDFQASASRVLPTAIASSSLTFYGGPFVIDQVYATQALAILNAYASNVAVYSLDAATSVDVRHLLTDKAFVGVYVEGERESVCVC
jgi:hypothetical protein